MQEHTRRIRGTCHAATHSLMIAHQSSAGTTIINYSEPITVSAGNLPPGDATAQTTSEEKSSVAIGTL